MQAPSPLLISYSPAQVALFFGRILLLIQLWLLSLKNPPPFLKKAFCCCPAKLPNKGLQEAPYQLYSTFRSLLASYLRNLALLCIVDPLPTESFSISFMLVYIISKLENCSPSNFHRSKRNFLFRRFPLVGSRS